MKPKKKKRKAKPSSGEKSCGAPLNDSKNEKKIKDASDGENLLGALKDGDFILPHKITG